MAALSRVGQWTWMFTVGAEASSQAERCGCQECLLAVSGALPTLTLGTPVRSLIVEPIRCQFLIDQPLNLQRNFQEYVELILTQQVKVGIEINILH